MYYNVFYYRSFNIRFLYCSSFIVVYGICMWSLGYITSSSLETQPTIMTLSKTIDNKYPFISKAIQQRLLILGQKYVHLNISQFTSTSMKTKTLTYLCESHCGGWGDRLRGITSVYILAILTNRHFMINMNYPCDLKNFLQPNIYDWTWKPSKNLNRKKLYLDTLRNKYRDDLYFNISKRNFIQHWSEYDDIFLTTNSDYITPALNNSYLSDIIVKLNIKQSDSNQKNLFSFIFEILFRPTFKITNIVDDILKLLYLSNSTMICFHIRIGKNPTIPSDTLLYNRSSIVKDMINFVDKNILNSNINNLIFVTGDSKTSISEILHHYPKSSITVTGPIVHIDRFDKSINNDNICHGFSKVIAEFYLLGECNTSLLSYSGFSAWANRRRTDEFKNLYLYCRGVKKVTGPTWRRPHTIC